MRIILLCFVVYISCVGIGIDRSYAQEIEVKMEKTTGQVRTLPFVIVKMDLEKYPNFEIDVSSYKKLMADYLRAYVGAWAKAYLEDRKVPTEFNPFNRFLGRILVTTEGIKTIDELKAHFTREHFEGKKFNGKFVSRLREIAIYFELSGDMDFVKNWVARLDQIESDMEKMSGRLDELQAERGKGAESFFKGLATEVRQSVDGVNRISAKMAMIQIFSWVALGMSVLVGAMFLFSMSRR